MILLSVLAMASAVSALQPDSPPAGAYDCESALSDLARTVEATYVAFHIEVRRSESRLADYRAFFEGLARRASRTDADACHFLLREYVDRFSDPHLFIVERPRFAESEIAAHRAAARQVGLPFVRTRLGRAHLDPIEGIWSSPEDGEIAIVADTTAARFVAVRMQASETGAAGDVIGWFSRSEDGYHATLLSQDKTPRRLPASLQKNVMLHMAPITWGRRWPLSNFERLLAPSQHPRNPTFITLSENAALLSIPSFAPQFRSALEHLVQIYDGAIRSRDILIIDLRGNEGGSSGLRRIIEPYYAPIPSEGGGDSRQPVVLASRGVISCFEAQLENLPESEYRTTVETLIGNLRRHPGEFVPMPEGQSAPATTAAAETPLPSPRHVAFLLDEDTVSAAEAVLLRARRSDKVLLFGRNSGGSIDYQNVCVTSFGRGRFGHLLGYPSIASSTDLPSGGFNRTGVPVDVRLDPQERDPIAAILRHYEGLR